MVILAVTLVRVIVFKGAELHKVVVGSKMMGGSRRGNKQSVAWDIGHMHMWERSHGELT